MGCSPIFYATSFILIDSYVTEVDIKNIKIHKATTD